MASPMPLAPPVTMAILPRSLLLEDSVMAIEIATGIEILGRRSILGDLSKRSDGISLLPHMNGGMLGRKGKR